MEGLQVYRVIRESGIGRNTYKQVGTAANRHVTVYVSSINVCASIYRWPHTHKHKQVRMHACVYVRLHVHLHRTSSQTANRSHDLGLTCTYCNSVSSHVEGGALQAPLLLWPLLLASAICHCRLVCCCNTSLSCASLYNYANTYTHMNVFMRLQDTLHVCSARWSPSSGARWWVANATWSTHTHPHTHTHAHIHTHPSSDATLNPRLYFLNL